MYRVGFHDGADNVEMIIDSVLDDIRNWEPIGGIKTLTNKAILYAEKYGILDYKVVVKAWYTTITNHLSERATYKVTINLEKMKRKITGKMPRYYQKGNVNMYLW